MNDIMHFKRSLPVLSLTAVDQVEIKEIAGREKGLFGSSSFSIFYSMVTPGTFVIKLNMYCLCLGCQKKMTKQIKEVHGVHSFAIDADEGKVTVSGTVHPNTLLMKLQKDGKKAELLPSMNNDNMQIARARPVMNNIPCNGHHGTYHAGLPWACFWAPPACGCIPPGTLPPWPQAQAHPGYNYEPTAPPLPVAYSYLDDIHSD
ncbi:hypothetical protein F0562_031592 [Nyssa sinensis]|uniref:HMA domain-containing protein n=1 Tax=Nyssa sinensis TaxID=561372 RepID=A0A5J5ASZ3_9ASTE|nr:hypothetical protein F0562_031592 [Nyssa sinensis]